MHHEARFWDFGSADQMNTDINDASIPICNVSMSAMSVRWRHGWHVTLAIHFNPQCFDLPSSTAIPTCQYCIRHVTYYDAKLFECWPAVSDVGPTLKQHWVNVSCLLGSAPVINSRPNTATLTNCWASVVGGVPALKQRCLHVIVQRYACLPVWSVCPRDIHNNWWTNVEPTLIQRLVFAGLPIHMYGAYIICL